jgi:hypothetical protein
MDFLMLSIGGVLTAVSTVFLLNSIVIARDTKYSLFSFMSLCLSIGIFLFWPVTAIGHRIKDSSNYVIEVYPLQKINDKVFYVDSNGQIRQVNHSLLQFVDTSKISVKLTTYVPGWTYGIYVTGKDSLNTVEFVETPKVEVK